MADKKPGWHKEGSEYVLYNTEGKETKRQSTDPKTEVKKVTSNVGVVDPYHKGTKKEDLINRLTDEQAQLVRTDDVRRLQHQTGEPGVYGEKVSVEEFSKRNPEWTKKFEEKHGKFDPVKHAGIFQKEYNQHVKDLAKKRAEEAGYPKDEAEKMANDWVDVMGFQAGYTKGDPRGQDKKFGEFTSSRLEPQWKPYGKPDQKPEDQKAEDQKQGETKVTTTEDKKPPIERIPLATRTVEENTPWWLQDIVGVAGAFGDLNRIKRYPPWQAKPDVHLPGATFYDPNRELAANAEQANIQTQGLAAFTGPQALSARSSQIQGQALKNAADVMGRYNNLNVGLANELEQQRASILNTASQNQANLDTQLWDKYTIMNQQFDNAKAQARQELRKQYINAITNRAKAQALNSLYDNYYTDPSTGGMVTFINPNYMPNPTIPSATDEISQARKIVEELGVTPDEALRHVRSRRSQQSSGGDDYINNQGYQ